MARYSLALCPYLKQLFTCLLFASGAAGVASLVSGDWQATFCKSQSRSPCFKSITQRWKNSWLTSDIGVRCLAPDGSRSVLGCDGGGRVLLEKTAAVSFGTGGIRR